MVQSGAERYSALQSVTQELIEINSLCSNAVWYRAEQSGTERYIAEKSITNRYKPLQSVTGGAVRVGKAGAGFGKVGVKMNEVPGGEY